MAQSKDETTGLLLGLVGVVIFGLTLPATRLAVAELDPILVSLGRALVAAALGAAALVVTRQPLPARGDWGPLALTAAGVVFGFPVLATIAMQTAPAAHGGIIIAILPLATAVAAVLIARERPSLGFWLCSVAGSAAVVVYALVDHAGEAIGLSPADLLLIAAVAAAAIGYAQGAVLARHIGGWQVICWVLLLSAPLCLAGLWFFGGTINWQASPAAWLGFAYVAVMSQLVGFFAWYAGLALGGVAKVGQTQLLQTFVTLAGAALLNGETVGPLEIGFAFLVVAIVALGRRMQVTRKMAEVTAPGAS